MAISKEAYAYLHEIEKIPNWTDIPNDDKRIVKLRVLFGSYNPVKKTSQMIYDIYRAGEHVTTGTVEECAKYIGKRVNNVYNMATKSYHKTAGKNAYLAHKRRADN